MNAAVVLTVSKFVKSEIEKWIQTPLVKIQVIYNQIPMPTMISEGKKKKGPVLLSFDS
jgi:hypothetical protein